MWVTAAEMESSDSMSSWTEETGRPCEARDEAAVWPLEWLREPMMIWPFGRDWASLLAAAKPMPVFPPVMRMTGELVVVGFGSVMMVGMVLIL